MLAATAEFDEEQHIEPPEPHRLRREQIDGDHAWCLRSQELAPRGSCDPQIYAREHLSPVTPRHAPGDIHGAALPESVSPVRERIRGGDDRWTRAGCVRTTDRE